MRVWGLFKKYWDLIVGILTGIIFSILANLKIERIQLIYSIIILLLVNIGLLRIIKKEIEKRQGLKTRQRTIIDKVVDSQTSVKAVELGYHPMRVGEDIGYSYMYTIKKGRLIMKKIMNWLDKFKGYLLSTALMILSIVEMFGGYIAQVLGDKVIIDGVNIVSLAVLISSVIVAAISNNFDKEQKEKVKAILSKNTANYEIAKELNDVLKTQKTDLKELNKALSVSKARLNLKDSELKDKIETYNNKIALHNMLPNVVTSEQLAELKTAIDNSRIELANLNKQTEDSATLVNNKKISIAETKTKIKELKGLK